MTRTTRTILAGCLAALVLAIGAQGASAMTAQLTQGDSGRTVYLRKGDKVEVTVAENQSTPYAWKVQKRSSARVLKLTSSKYITSPAPPGIVGAPGKHVYKFTATGRGTTSFKAGNTYVGQGHRVAQKFSLKIVVR
jgi:predicted secreted protein